MKKKIVKKLNIIQMINSHSNFEYKYREKILNGVLLSQAIQNSISDKLDNLKMKYNINSEINNYKNSQISIPIPKLKVILIGDRMDSKVYVENKLKLCKTIGIEGELKLFPGNTKKEEIIEEIEKSNMDDKIHGIIIQLPLPEKLMLSRTEILSKVDLSKDVDGLNPLNQGKILQMNISECLLPPTAMGVLELLRLAIIYDNNIDNYIENYLNKHIFDDQPVDLSGLDVTVLGRGLTAGLPLSILMQKCNGTVTLCHSQTKNLISKCDTADILITAVGKCNLVTERLVKKDSILIDVGINVAFDPDGNKIITGDVEFSEVVDKVKFITPVPGGVGKMTVIMLLKNVIKAWGYKNKIDLSENI